MNTEEPEYEVTVIVKNRLTGETNELYIPRVLGWEMKLQPNEDFPDLLPVGPQAWAVRSPVVQYYDVSMGGRAYSDSQKNCLSYRVRAVEPE
jgi:hypothetical protein